MCARLINRKVNDVPSVFSPLGFEHIPIPAQVGNRFFRKIPLGGGLRDLFRGPTSDHSSGGSSACPLKRLNVVFPIFGVLYVYKRVGVCVCVSRCAKQKTAKHIANNKQQSFKGNLVTTMCVGRETIILHRGRVEL